MKFNKISFIAFCVAAILALPSIALAGKGGNKSGAGAVHGKVTAVDTQAKTITITPSKKKGGDASTFTVNDSTKISIEGKSVTLADIQIGMKARVTAGADPKSAASIKIKAGKKGGKKGQSQGFAPATSGK